MIVCKELGGKSFATKEEMIKELVENKSQIISVKKMETKQADAVVYVTPATTTKGETIKADNVDLSSINEIKASLVINTTNLMDSHSDVHMKGIWKKSVKEAKNIVLLQEHIMKFDHIISDNVTASVKEMAWADLGVNYKGTTEALIFDTTISKSRNEFMFMQYAKGYVKNHSVGMKYVQLELAVDSESKWYSEEKEVWDKYIDEVVNKEDAIQQGYFWVVTEAKIIEGSAVVKGSNYVTPVLSASAKNIEPDKSTQTNEPTQVTQGKNAIDWQSVINKF